MLYTRYVSTGMVTKYHCINQAHALHIGPTYRLNAVSMLDQCPHDASQHRARKEIKVEPVDYPTRISRSARLHIETEFLISYFEQPCQK